MTADDSIVLDLVRRVSVATASMKPQPMESLDVLRDPGFEDYLLKANQGIALYSASEYFFYVSKSLGKIVGYPLSLIYEKGPGFFQQLITPHNKPLVQKIATKSQQAFAPQHASRTVRLSFDYHIIAGDGELKRVYQHTLPGAVVSGNEPYTLLILMDLTGFKTSPALNFKVSFMTQHEKFETILEGTVNPPIPYQLTKREIEILNRLARGESAKEISGSLFISEETMKKHRQNILRKGGVNKIVVLINEGLRDGWIHNI